MNLKNEEGYTLMEMVTVLAIIVILITAISVPVSYFIDKQYSNNMVAMNENMEQALVVYYGLSGETPLDTSFRPNNNYNDISETASKNILNKIYDMTGITISKDYSHNEYKMNVTYKNAYILKITFDKR